MSVMFRSQLLIVCAVALSSARGFLPMKPTPFPAPAAASITAQTLNAFLQIQEQLHATQLAIESNRAAAAAKRNARRHDRAHPGLEQTVAAQRASEIEATQKAQRLTLILAGAFGVVGLAAHALHGLFPMARRHAAGGIVRAAPAGVWPGQRPHCRRR